MAYADFVREKFVSHVPSGIASTVDLPAAMFGHQAALTRWALRRGRAAVFADTGLGKMLIELAWADVVNKYTERPVMIHTPLAVAPQIASEGRKFGIEATVVREAADVTPGINITNYDRLHKFDTSIFGGIVLDESGCIKHHDAKTFRALTDAYRDTPFKLPATATPAPNDWTELGTHAEFLGICTRAEMLAEFFTHDGGDTGVWRLKGHARSIFWKWVASWGAMIRRPSDLGFDDGAYNLPPLQLHEHTVESKAEPLDGALFAMEAQTLSERRNARRASMAARVAECASTVYNEWGSHALEARVRSSTQSEVGDRPGVPGQTERAGVKRPGRAKGVHADLLRSEAGEVRAADAGEAGGTEPGEAATVCGERRMARAAQGVSQGVAGSQSGEAQSATAPQVRDDPGTIRQSDGGAEPRLCNLRHDGSGAEDVPNDRSLPHDRQGSRDSLLSLQHGAREVQGRPGAARSGYSVPLEPWLIWCELNDEQDALEKAFGDLAFSVRGANSNEEKEAQIAGWLAGERPVMISKASILGWGLNFQHCRRMAFVGVTDSFESYYQAVRRCWRFGQKRPVDVHLFASSQEGAVAANLRRKERDAKEMAESLSTETAGAVFAEVVGATRETNGYAAVKRVAVPSFLLEPA